MLDAVLLRPRQRLLLGASSRSTSPSRSCSADWSPCALGYLLSERQLRPIAALALASGVPARPQLPGVAARTALSWTLGAGVPLLGLVLVGLAALIDGHVLASRSSQSS